MLSICNNCVTRSKLLFVQGLEILKASLQSKTVLTDVFLAKKTTTNPSSGVN
jgi:hypothetical protein